MNNFLFYILLIGFSFSLNAQTVYDKPLTDDIIKKVLPVLSAEAESQKDASNYNSVINYDTELSKIEDGSIDPYMFIKDKSTYAVVPEGVIYDENASRYITHQLRTPAAVFTFGLEASEYSKEIYFTHRKPDSTFLEKLRTRPDNKKVSFLINSASKFYNEHKFDEITEYYSPDNSLKVQLNEASYYHFMNYPDISTGPLILLILTNPGNPREDCNIKFRKALSESGLSLLEYKHIKNILVQALMDSKDLNIFKTDSKRPTNQAEQKLYAEEQKMLNIRKMNAYLYNKYADDLNPIFKELSLMAE
jgi:hypothetical protein